MFWILLNFCFIYAYKPHIRNTWCQFVPLLMFSAFITWLSWWLLAFFSIKLVFLLEINKALWGDNLRLFTYPLCCHSVTKSCPALCNPMDCSIPGFPALHYLLEFVQIHVPWVGNTIQPSHPPLPFSPFAFNHSQHQGLFQWVGSSHQVAKVLELQHQSFQWIFRTEIEWLISL